jgi:hypothetical protein
MNERIRKLYVKAAYVECPDGLFPRETFDYEKFAELIVRECMEVAHPKLTDVGEWAAGMRLVQQRLKQHFGVEE